MLAENQITLEIVSDGGIGPQGPQGPQGEQGIQGPTGNDGKSAYEAAVEEGYTGTEAQFNSDLADTSVTKETANSALETAESILIYDTSYYIENNTARFTAYVYQGGTDIKTQFDAEQFTWYLKNENGSGELQAETYLGYGYTMDVSLSDCGYGSEVIGKFTTTDDAEALSVNNETLTTANDETITVRAEGDAVRVRELTTTTTIYPQEKLMVVGTEDEHLITMQTLQDYLNLNLDKQVLFDTTANWNAQTTLVSDANTLYVYTDHATDSQNRNVAGIKAGDGSAYVVDLPFIDAIATEHIADTTRHITSAERTRWNDAVKCYYAGTENLIFANV